MARASEHRQGAALGVGLASLAYELTRGAESNISRPLIASSLAAAAGTLPDLLEPATNPNHRRFLHNIAFFIAVSYGLRKLYKWDPETDLQKALKFAGLSIGGAYLVHLAMDFVTPKSLPIL